MEGRPLRCEVMKRVLAFLVLLTLSLSMGSAAMAHSLEPVGCVDMIQPMMSDGHAAGDGDEVPSDSGKAYPHHHGTCPGHAIGLPAADVQPLVAATIGSLAPIVAITSSIPFDPEAPQRPPRA